MAKPKGMDKVGWSTNPAMYETNLDVLAEWDVNQTKNRKTGQGQTYSKGHQVRQIGLVRRNIGAFGSFAPTQTYQIYTHSQVSNGAYFRYDPPAYVGLTRNDLERLWMEIGKELFGKE